MPKTQLTDSVIDAIIQATLFIGVECLRYRVKAIGIVDSEMLSGYV